MNRYFKANLFFILIYTVVGMLTLLSARAGTFNYYFNNVEQGANSNASPQISAQDGKAQKSATVSPSPEVSESPKENVTIVGPSPTPSHSPSPVPSPSITPTPAITQNESKFNHGIIGFSGITLEPKLMNRAQTESFARRWGGAVSLGYAFNPDFALKGFAGQITPNGKSGFIFGTQAEIMPLHLSLFRSDSIIDLGGSLGFMNVHSEVDQPRKTFGYVGPQVQLNLGPKTTLFGAYRFGREFNTAEAGLMIRF